MAAIVIRFVVKFAMQEVFGSQEDIQLLKALWTFVLKIFGLLFVTYIGPHMMLKWFADNLGSIPVSYFFNYELQYLHNSKICNSCSYL